MSHYYLMFAISFLFVSSISKTLEKFWVHCQIFVCSYIDLMNWNTFILNICCIYWFPRDFKLGGIIFVHRTVWCWVCTVGRVTACLMEVSVKTESASFCVFQMVFRWLIFLKDDMPSVSVPSLYVNSVFCPLKISVQWATVWRREATCSGRKVMLGSRGHAPGPSGVFLTINARGGCKHFLWWCWLLWQRDVFVKHGTAAAPRRASRLLEHSNAALIFSLDQFLQPALEKFAIKIWSIWDGNFAFFHPSYSASTARQNMFLYLFEKQR